MGGCGPGGSDGLSLAQVVVVNVADTFTVTLVGFDPEISHLGELRRAEGVVGQIVGPRELVPHPRGVVRVDDPRVHTYSYRFGSSASYPTGSSSQVPEVGW
jgi:hypothetical protein